MTVGTDDVAAPTNRPSFWLDTLYRYDVNGRHFTGMRKHFGILHTRSWPSADQAALEYETGRQVVVYYDPRNPSRSVLEPGANVATFIDLACTVAVMGLGVWSVLLAA